MWNHNSDVDTSEKLLDMINGFNQNISLPSCSGTYGIEPDVPNFSEHSGFCLHSSPERQKHTFDCGKSALEPIGQKKQRLCYCH